MENQEKEVKKRATSKEKIERLELEIKDLKDKNLRLIAEFENSRKRLEQQRILDRKYASKNLIESLLESMTQFDKIVEMKTEEPVLKNFLIGFKMIKDNLFKTLEADGLKEIKALHEKFDPNLHEAVEKLKDEQFDKGLNLEVVTKGYTYKEQLIRPAMVKVNEWSDENGENK